MFISPHLIGAGIGGQFVHKPSSTVPSRLRRKNGTTSSVPALVTVLLPQVLKVADAAASSGDPGLGVLGWFFKAAIVVISWWKCSSNGSWNLDMIFWSSAPSKSLGDLSEVR